MGRGRGGQGALLVVAGWDTLDYVHCFSLSDWQAPCYWGWAGDGGSVGAEGLGWGLKVAGRRH